MSKATNKLSPEVSARAIRMVLDQGEGYSSRWAVALSISAKIGSSPLTVMDWVKLSELDTITHAPRPSTGFKRLRTFIGAGRGVASRMWNSPPWHG
jgi:hypothetical protein